VPGYDEFGNKIKTFACLGIKNGDYTAGKFNQVELFDDTKPGIKSGVILFGNKTYIPKRAEGKLLAKDTAGSRAVVLNNHGKGKALWTCQDNGAFYLGKVARQTHAGNTPPLYLEQPETAQNKELGSKIFSLVDMFMTSCEIKPEVTVKPQNRSVEVVGHYSDNEQLMFFVNRDRGVISGMTANILVNKQPAKVVILSDYSEKVVTDYKYADGTLTVVLPDFETTSIIRIK
jgi:hypothetical protein